MAEEGEDGTNLSKLVATSGPCGGDVFADWTSLGNLENDLFYPLLFDLTEVFSSFRESPDPTDGLLGSRKEKGGSKVGSDDKGENLAAGETKEQPSTLELYSATLIDLEKKWPLAKQEKTQPGAMAKTKTQALRSDPGSKDEKVYMPTCTEIEVRSPGDVHCQLDPPDTHENESPKPHNSSLTFEISKEPPSTDVDEAATNCLGKPLEHSRKSTIALRRKRNRESARRSYIRKQSYLRTLERSVRTLEATNQILQSKVEDIEKLLQELNREKIPDQEMALAEEVRDLLEALDPTMSKGPSLD